MKQQRIKIYPAEARIIQTLYQTPRNLTSNEVAVKSGVSWPTAIKYLQKWKEKGLVKIKKENYHSIKYNKEMEREVWEIKKEEIDKALNIR